MADFNRSTLTHQTHIKGEQSAHSTFIEPLPFTLLSNSSFNYLNMYGPQIPARTSSQLSLRAPRSRITTNTSAGSNVTSFEILEAQRMRVSAIPKRVPVPRCPPVPSRKEGASLPRSPAMRDLDVLAQDPVGLAHLAGTLLPFYIAFTANIAVEPLFGSSNQRSRRLANKGTDESELENARNEHLATTMETLTFSPSTVESVSLATPPAASGGLRQRRFPRPAAYDAKTGLGLGFIGTQAVQAPTKDRVANSPPLSPPDTWRFTLPHQATSPSAHSRNASSHLFVEPPTGQEKRLTGSSKAESRLPSAGASLVDSYYYGSQSGKGDRSRPPTRGPSRLGMNQDGRRMSVDGAFGNRSSRPGGGLDDPYRFAFTPPPLPRTSGQLTASPPPIDFTKSPSIDFTRSPVPSVSKRLTPPSPHKIKRKPVPTVEEWTLAVDESIKTRFDLPTESKTVPRPQRQPRMYIHGGRAAQSTPIFEQVPLHSTAEASPPLLASKSTGTVQTLKESFKFFSASYRNKAFGEKSEGDISSTSISTGESTDLQTPRESYEDFAKIPVRKQERTMENKPIQATTSQNGYTTHAQREAARLAEEQNGEKKKKGRLAKLFAIH